MAQHDRRLYALVAFYLALALAWLAFAGWVRAALLTAEHPGSITAAVKHYIESFASAFLPRETVARWRVFSIAVLIAMPFHLSIVILLRSYDRRAALSRSAAELRAERGLSLWLAIVSLVFLAVTLTTASVHDYYYYLNMWYEVEQGHDPWFLVAGSNGVVPLNSYGPLFNILTAAFWVNPLAPKILFAYAYILFAVREIKRFTANHRPSVGSLVVLAALFWNPFPWVEIAVRGHFDILVSLLCLRAIRTWVKGRDFVSGTYLALGVLLKFLPVVFLPFLALDRGRIRPRFLATAIALIAIGLAVSFWIWGPTMFSPLTFAATRRSNFMSIFCFLRGRYSPLAWVLDYRNLDKLAPIVLFVALLRAWSWYRIRHPDVVCACVVAAIVTAIFYHTGFPQYHMVPFVLGACWVLEYWGVLRDRPARAIAVACYLGWLAVLNLYYLFINEFSGGLYWDVVQDVAGLPTFLFGCGFIAAVVRSAGPASPGGSAQPGSPDRGEPAAGVDPTA